MYINDKLFGYGRKNEPLYEKKPEYQEEYEPKHIRTEEENKAREIAVLIRMDKLGMIQWKPVRFIEVYGVCCTVYQTVHGIAYKTVWENGEAEYYK